MIIWALSLPPLNVISRLTRYGPEPVKVTGSGFLAVDDDGDPLSKIQLYDLIVPVDALEKLTESPLFAQLGDAEMVAFG